MTDDHASKGFMHRRTKHRVTKAEGRITGMTASLYEKDDMGPWCFVVFDDGLECWVAEADLDTQAEVEVRRVGGPGFILDDEDNVVVVFGGVERFCLSVDGVGLTFGVWIGHKPADKGGEWHTLAYVPFDQLEAPSWLCTDKEVLDVMADQYVTGELHLDVAARTSVRDLVALTGRDVEA